MSLKVLVLKCVTVVENKGGGCRKSYGVTVVENGGGGVQRAQCNCRRKKTKVDAAKVCSCRQLRKVEAAKVCIATVVENEGGGRQKVKKREGGGCQSA